MINESFIERKANKLLHKSGINTPFVPVENITKSLGFQLKLEAFEDEFSGCIIRKNKQVIIGVNLTHSENRRRFTIAHEIGHYFLHEGKDTWDTNQSFKVNMRGSQTKNDPQELEANFFAASLLMPANFLAADLEGQRLDIVNDRTLDQLAKRYKVSTQALIRRLAYLGHLPATH